MRDDSARTRSQIVAAVLAQPQTFIAAVQAKPVHTLLASWTARLQFVTAVGAGGAVAGVPLRAGGGHRAARLAVSTTERAGVRDTDGARVALVVGTARCAGRSARRQIAGPTLDPRHVARPVSEGGVIAFLDELRLASRRA